MMTQRPRLSCAMLVPLFLGVVFSQGSDGQSSKAIAASASKTQQLQDSTSGIKQRPLQESLPASSMYGLDEPFDAEMSDELDDIFGAAENAGEFDNAGDILAQGENRFISKRPKPRFVGKRLKPRFVGKRYKPRFVGKRYKPRFVGKRYKPRFVGKRYKPRFVGKRSKFTMAGVRKRVKPRFVGKRYIKDLCMQGEELVPCVAEMNQDLESQQFSDYFPESGSSEAANGDDYAGTERNQDEVEKLLNVLKGSSMEDTKTINPDLRKRAKPRFVGKRENLQEETEEIIQDMLDNWSRNMAFRKLQQNDKRWAMPIQPGQIGKRDAALELGFQR